MHNMDSTPSLPDSDRDWTTVNFPGAMSLEALAGEDPEDDRLAARPPEPSRSGTDLLRPYWSGDRPVRSPISLPFQREEPNGGGSMLNGDTTALPKGPADVGQLVAVAEALHRENEQLRQQVARLEAAVAECRATLELQQMRAQTQQALYDARSRDFDSTKQEAARLATALDAAQATVARHDQVRMEWAQQEELDRGRIAQLERSCALLQEQCLKQTDELMQAATTDRELRGRLQRQQRQTLQLRAALEKCLDHEYGRSGLRPLGQTEPQSLTLPDQSSLEPIDAAGIDAIGAELPGLRQATGDRDAIDAIFDDLIDNIDEIERITAIGKLGQLAAANVEAAALQADSGTDRPALSPDDNIRAEEILALLNWDLDQQRPAPSYRITAAAAAEPARATDSALDRDDPRWVGDRDSFAADGFDRDQPTDLDGLDDLADALWLSDWPRPLSQADVAESDPAIATDPDQNPANRHPSASLDRSPLSQRPEPIEPEPQLAKPLADLLSIEAELMDWSPRSPQAPDPAPPVQPQSQWPAPTLSQPRKRRASLAAVELPKF